MAVVVNKLPEKEGWIAAGGKANRYPWQKWLDGRIWRLTRADYRGRPENFRMAAYQQAKRVGLRVRIRQPGETGVLYLQAYTPKARTRK